MSKETRCKKCKRLFFRGEFEKGDIEIKCPKCGYIQNIFRKPQKKLDFIGQPPVEFFKT